MNTRFKQLQAEELVTLASELQRERSLRSIARTLGRSASGLRREVARNGTATGRYIQPDHIGLEGWINRYAYVGGNPVDSHQAIKGVLSGSMGSLSGAALSSAIVEALRAGNDCGCGK